MNSGVGGLFNSHKGISCNHQDTRTKKSAIHAADTARSASRARGPSTQTTQSGQGPARNTLIINATTATDTDTSRGTNNG